MKRMPNIKLSQTELRIILSTNHIVGSEGYIINNISNNSMYKIFGDALRKDEGLSENKANKIKKLYDAQLEYSVKPLSTISVNGKLVGYEMTYDKEDLSLDSIKYEIIKKQKLHFLRETKRILEYFSTKDITYGDVASRNVLVNVKTGETKFCDMDNIRYGEYPIDIMHSVLEDYSKVREIDTDADTFMHNLMIIEQLGKNGTYSEIMKEIKANHIPRGYKRKGKQIIKTMTNPLWFTGESILPYVRGIRK